MPFPQIPSRTLAAFATSAIRLSPRSRTPLLALTALVFSALAAAQKSPILVELFTSEGCSDCPPADTLLAQIAKERRDVIVLSEHVDYWNYLGWTDPFSSAASTQRQQDYAQRFRGEGPYTPQMVVDGTRQFVGSDRAALRAALDSESDKPKPAMTLTVIEDHQPESIQVAIRLDSQITRAHLIAVLVQNEGHQDVKRGENGGHTLKHVNVAREFHDLGEVSPGHAFDGQTRFKLPPGAGKPDFHIVVFLQQNPGGPILASAATA